jgi:hypothetical protein
MKKKNQGAYSTSSSSSASVNTSSMSTIVTSARSKDKASKERGKDGTSTLDRPKRNKEDDSDGTSKRNSRSLRRGEAKAPTLAQLGLESADEAAATEKKSADGSATPNAESDADKKMKREGSRKIENITFAIDVPAEKLDPMPSPASSSGTGKLTSPRSYTRSVSSPRLSANAVIKEAAVRSRDNSVCGTDASAIDAPMASVAAPLTMAATSSPRVAPGASTYLLCSRDCSLA